MKKRINQSMQSKLILISRLTAGNSKISYYGIKELQNSLSLMDIFPTVKPTTRPPITFTFTIPPTAPPITFSIGIDGITGGGSIRF